MVVLRVLPEEVTHNGRYLGFAVVMRRAVALGQHRASNGNIDGSRKVHVVGIGRKFSMCGRKTERMRLFRGVYSQITCRRCLRNDWFDLTALG